MNTRTVPNTSSIKFNIAVLFITTHWKESYSLTSVVKSQIRGLVANGFKCKVLNNKGCPPWKFPSKVQYHACIPKFNFDFTKTKINDEFYKKIDKAVGLVAPYLKDVDIVLAHDVIFLEPLLPYSLIIRGIAKRYPHIKWLHWCHSTPGLPYPRSYPWSLINTSMPNSRIVSVTKTHRKAFAKLYSVPLKDVEVVPNPRVAQDFLNFHPLSWKIIRKFDLLAADIINVMATRISRDAKQPEICLFIMAALKKQGRSVRQIFINSFDKNNLMEEAHILHLKHLAQKLGLNEQEVVFTSLVTKSLAGNCPPIIVRDLFLISNIFILPSVAEACSLTLLEAAITKHLCILNSDLKSCREIVGGHAIWVKFEDIANVMKGYMAKHNKEVGLDWFFTYYKDHEKNYHRIARQIISSLKRDTSQGAFSWAKSRFNEDAIFKKYIWKLFKRP